ncbi:hypothetical protein MalM25_22950 [Planctomycetes bacterium MalM25]|nr:hypothetical protein MalM25_22950 [Planctomycetes bacterium MalM25]
MNVSSNPTDHRFSLANLMLLTAVAAALAVSINVGELAEQLSGVRLLRPAILVPVGLAGFVGWIVGLLVGVGQTRSLRGALIGCAVGWAAGLYLAALIAAPSGGLRIASGAMIVCLAPLAIRASVD